MRLNDGSKREGGTTRDSLVFTGEVAQLARSRAGKINARVPRMLTDNGIMVVCSLGLLPLKTSNLPRFGLWSNAHSHSEFSSARAIQSHCQPHRKRESQHRVNGC